MSLTYGLVCISEVLKGANKELSFKTITRKRFNDLSAKNSRDLAVSELSAKISHNLKLTNEIVRFCAQNGIGHYRLSSKLFPLVTDPTLEIDLHELPNFDKLKNELADIGRFITANSISTSIHPDQFNVLASEKKDVVDKTVLELNFQAWLLDKIGMPQDYTCPINIHPSVSTKDPSEDNLKEIVDRFWAGFQKTNEGVQNRLVVENEDKGCWNCMNLFKYFHIYARESFNHPFPLTYDNLHNSCNPSSVNGAVVSDNQNVQAFYHTWNTSPVFHWSEPKSNKPSEKRSHADYLSKNIPEFKNSDGTALQIKWECEVKAKDKAILKILGNKASVNPRLERFTPPKKKKTANKKSVAKPKVVKKQIANEKLPNNEESPKITAGPETLKNKVKKINPKKKTSNYNHLYGI